LLPPKSVKSREILRKFQQGLSSKAIDLGVSRKRICNFLIVINGKFGRNSYRFPDIEVAYALSIGTKIDDLG